MLSLEGEYLVPIDVEFRAHTEVVEVRERAAEKEIQLCNLRSSLNRGFVIRNGVELRLNNKDVEHRLREVRRLENSIDNDVNYLHISNSERVLKELDFMPQHPYFPSVSVDEIFKADENKFKELKKKSRD